MRRVFIIGSPGSGKSTLARRMAQGTGLPLIHLDAEYWQAGWKEPAPAVWQERIATLVARNRWIMDGNYGGTMDRRLVRADTVVLLDYPTALCLARIVKRRLVYWRGTRPDMAPGCPERLDWSFLRYVANFRRSSARRIAARLADFPGEVIRLRHPREAEAFLAGLA